MAEQHEAAAAALRSVSGRTRWRAECATCGHVGRTREDKGRAEREATKHRERAGG